MLLRVQLLRPKVMGGFVVKLLEQSARLERASIQVWSLCRPVASIGNTLYSVVVVERLFVETMHGQSSQSTVQPIYLLILSSYVLPNPESNQFVMPDRSQISPSVLLAARCLASSSSSSSSHSHPTAWTCCHCLSLPRLVATVAKPSYSHSPCASPGHHNTDKHATQFFGSQTWPPDRDAPP